ncbi:MAG: tyrosine-protein kinase [Acidimicrobiaceae bacterium]|nr:tyrosine-protein kinase [Acidimicrobiaceae bacterium]
MPEQDTSIDTKHGVHGPSVRTNRENRLNRVSRPRPRHQVASSAMEPTAPFEVNLRDYLHVFGRRKGTILFAVFVIVVVVLTSTLLQTPTYQATASVVLRPSSAESLLNPSSNVASNFAANVQTEVSVVTSGPVKQAVRAQLGLTPNVSVASVGTTNVIAISADSTVPENAAIIANSYADNYINFRRNQDLNGALAAESQIQTRIADLQTQVEKLNNQLRTDPKSQATITPQIDSLVTQEGTFKQQLGQLQVAAALTSGDAQVVNAAAIPSTPVKPRPVRYLLLAIIAGLVLGVGAAFSVDFLDDSLKSTEELERAIGFLPTAAAIPRVSNWRTKDVPMLVSLTEPQSPAAESYRTLRTAIQFAALDRPMRTLQVTSPSAGEGKTTTLANLGVALAQGGHRVIITCCDLRRPRLHEFFGLDNTVGFTSVYMGNVPIQAALRTVPGVDGLRLLASGPLPLHPSDILASARAAEVFAALQSEADIVLIDSPPVLPVADAAILSQLADATLLVVTAGSTTRSQVINAVEALRQVDAPLFAAVVNGASAQWAYGEPYKYYRYDAGPRRRWDLGQRRRRVGSEPSTPERVDV